MYLGKSAHLTHLLKIFFKASTLLGLVYIYQTKELQTLEKFLSQFFKAWTLKFLVEEIVFEKLFSQFLEALTQKFSKFFEKKIYYRILDLGKLGHS